MGLHGGTFSVLVGLLLSVGLVGSAPAGAGAAGEGRVPDPTLATVSGHCWGGSGVVVMAARPVSGTDGTYRIDVSATDMVEESRWTVRILSDGGDPALTLHRRVVDGGWSATAEVQASPEERVFFARAHERGDSGHGCRVASAQVDTLSAALATCRPGLSLVIYVRHADGDTVRVPFFVNGERTARERWHVDMTATGTGADQTVTYDDIARDGEVRSRVDFGGIANPQLGVGATRRGSVHCTLAFDPPDATDAARTGGRISHLL